MSTLKIGARSLSASSLSSTRPSNTILGTQRNRDHQNFLNPGLRTHFIAIMPTASNLNHPDSERGAEANYSTSTRTVMADAGASTGASTSHTRSGRSGDGLERFQLSPVPTGNSLKQQGRCIRSAAALVIGDEILNGKTMDKNSNYFAKYCFERGIDLKRIEVIPDDEAAIIEASRRMVEKYDFVITTGGIGPTHDDITYASLARAFNQPLAHHSETLRRLDEMNKHRAWVSAQTPQQREATKRMALFPESAEVIFTCGDIWVPVVRLEGKLCVFPGIPTLFTKMLDGLERYLPLPPANERPMRVQIFTERPESMIAPYLTALHSRLKKQKAEIQVGSYPVLGKGVFVSLIGRDRDMGIPAQGMSESGTKPGRVWLAQIASEVEREVGGRIVSEEEVKAVKEGGVGEVRRRMEEGVRARALSSMNANEGKKMSSDVEGPSSASSVSRSRSSSPASTFACDSASVAESGYSDVKAAGSKPKLGEVGWR